MAISPALVVYKTAAGHSVPAIVLAAYDTNGAVVTDISDTVTADLQIIGRGVDTPMNGVAKGTAVNTFAFLTAYSA